MTLDLLVCQGGAACNGSLALIALSLAGSLHQKLKMNFFAPVWVRIILQW